MTISSVAAIANLIVLETKLLRAFKTESSNPDAMQLRYSVALRATANCLMRVGIEEEIAHKFIELASAIKEEAYHSYDPRKPAAALMTAK